jgi:predicted DNA-binding transcriptional regulator YafY
MDKFDRIYQLHHMLKAHRHAVPYARLCDEMECAYSSLKRIVAEMRAYLGAPIVNRRGVGYFYDPTQTFELPGLWFNREELESLLAMHELMARIDPGLLAEGLAPVRRRVEALLAKMAPEAGERIERIRILPMNRRRADLPHFPRVAGAVLESRRLAFGYSARSTGEGEQREVSPQRLVHYRDNWYLDAFCHARGALRTFSLDCMRAVRALDTEAHEVDADELDRLLTGSYGIFAGRPEHEAVLRFSPYAARWVAEEQWHPEQRGRMLDDGRYELVIPYADATELIMDICRHGPEVEVLAPAGLRQAVAERLRRAADRYD